MAVTVDNSRRFVEGFEAVMDSLAVDVTSLYERNNDLGFAPRQRERMKNYASSGPVKNVSEAGCLLGLDAVDAAFLPVLYISEIQELVPTMSGGSTTLLIGRLHMTVLPGQFDTPRPQDNRLARYSYPKAVILSESLVWLFHTRN